MSPYEQKFRMSFEKSRSETARMKAGLGIPGTYAGTYEEALILADILDEQGHHLGPMIREELGFWCGYLMGARLPLSVEVRFKDSPDRCNCMTYYYASKEVLIGHGAEPLENLIGELA